MTQCLVFVKRNRRRIRGETNDLMKIRFARQRGPRASLSYSFNGYVWIRDNRSARRFFNNIFFFFFHIFMLKKKQNSALPTDYDGVQNERKHGPHSHGSWPSFPRAFLDLTLSPLHHLPSVSTRPCGRCARRTPPVCPRLDTVRRRAPVWQKREKKLVKNKSTTTITSAIVE